MGVVARSIFVLIAGGCSIAAIIALAIILIGPTTGNLSNLYFLGADFSNFTHTLAEQIPDLASAENVANEVIDHLPKIDGVSTNTIKNFASVLESSLKTGNLSDVYVIGLGRYCSGNDTQPWNGKNKPNYKLSSCGPHQFPFVFDPIQVWGLNNTAIQNFLPNAVKDGLHAYRVAIHVVHILFVVATGLTGLTLLSGLPVIYTPRMSLKVLSLLSALFAALCAGVAAGGATGVYSVLEGVLKTNLGPFGVRFFLGSGGLAVAWLSAGLNFAAFILWSFALCCMSRYNPNAYNHRAGHGGEKDVPTRWGQSPSYEPLAPTRSPGARNSAYSVPNQVPSPVPFNHHDASPHHDSGALTGYEPFRGEAARE